MKLILMIMLILTVVSCSSAFETSNDEFYLAHLHDKHVSDCILAHISESKDDDTAISVALYQAIANECKKLYGSWTAENSGGR